MLAGRNESKETATGRKCKQDEIAKLFSSKK
jgi:hypothetical protein